MDRKFKNRLGASRRVSLSDSQNVCPRVGTSPILCAVDLKDQREMKPRRAIARALPVVGLAWLVLAGATIVSRPLLAIDETRYATVAWEMWTSGDYLVPHLGGDPYSHKPPLLFWIVCAGWWVFGEHDWVARGVGPLFGFFAAAMTMMLGSLLWPDDDRTPPTGAWTLTSFPMFALYASALMFDALLTGCVLVALCGVVLLTRTAVLRGAGLIVLGIGAGILAKGPVTFVYVLPVALVAAWWAPAVRARWLTYYAGLGLAVVTGAGVGLAWAIPAARSGGEEYGGQILWSQTAGRVTQSFAHEQPFWFYVALLPIVFIPWLYFRPAWAGLRNAGLGDPGIRFALVWIGGTIAVLSLVSGKQPYYLLPIFPGIALLAAKGVTEARLEAGRPWKVLGVAAVVLLGILGLVVLTRIVEVPFLFDVKLALWPPAAGAAVLIATSRYWTAGSRRSTAGVLALAMLTVLISIMLVARPLLWSRFDVAPIAREIARLQDEGAPVIYAGTYWGQFTFLGRLQEPLKGLRPMPNVVTWCKGHPDGYVVRRTRGEVNPYTDDTILDATYRNKDRVTIVRARAFIEH
jgi:4-amino-4-deoxy-L-arabinose transferase-like glycosyltransferase